MSGFEIRSEFKTKDGVYKNLRSHQFSKPRGQPLLGKELSETKISLVSVKDMQGLSEWMVFNSGRELLCYPFDGTQQPPDLSSPVDKHTYKSSYPIAHDINIFTRTSERIDLIIGFNGGPLQHLNPLAKSCLATFNTDRSIDDTDVTCVKWVPASENQFVSSHRSGCLYFWTTEYPYRSSNLPTFHLHKQFKDTVIDIGKPKKGSCILYRWNIGHGAIQHFDFSPDTRHIAVANQDGFLRIYNFETQELYGRMRSFYGGFICVCWSPDGRYVATGGEDDLISVWSFEEKQVLARGQGHQSYVNKVTFDPYTSETDVAHIDPPSLSESQLSNGTGSTGAHELKSQRSSRFFPEVSRSYRIGSVGQDGLLCLWELSGDSLCVIKRCHRRSSRTRIKPTSTIQSEDDTFVKERTDSTGAGSTTGRSDPRVEDSIDGSKPNTTSDGDEQQDSLVTASIGSDVSGKKSEEKSKKKNKKKKRKDGSDSVDPVTQDKTDDVAENSADDSSKNMKKIKTQSASEKSHKKFSVRKTVSKFINGSSLISNRRTVGQFESCQSDDIAPSMQDINLIEPLVCKRVWSERLTDVMFREDCLLTATQDGFVQVWGRPGFIADDEPISSQPSGLNSPRPDSKHTSV